MQQTQNSSGRGLNKVAHEGETRGAGLNPETQSLWRKSPACLQGMRASHTLVPELGRAGGVSLESEGVPRDFTPSSGLLSQRPPPPAVKKGGGRVDGVLRVPLPTPRNALGHWRLSFKKLDLTFK